MCSYNSFSYAWTSGTVAKIRRAAWTSNSFDLFSDTKEQSGDYAAYPTQHERNCSDWQPPRRHLLPTPALCFPQSTLYSSLVFADARMKWVPFTTMHAHHAPIRQETPTMVVNNNIEVKSIKCLLLNFTHVSYEKHATSISRENRRESEKCGCQSHRKTAKKSDEASAFEN